MPYIPPERRDHLDTDSVARNTGELTFEITRLIDAYHDAHEDNFQTRSEIVSALECAKMEFYRQVVSPYEDKKCEENGDVYDAHVYDDPVKLRIKYATWGQVDGKPGVWKYHPQNRPAA